MASEPLLGPKELFKVKNVKLFDSDLSKTKPLTYTGVYEEDFGPFVFVCLLCHVKYMPENEINMYTFFKRWLSTCKSALSVLLNVFKCILAIELRGVVLFLIYQVNMGGWQVSWDINLFKCFKLVNAFHIGM